MPRGIDRYIPGTKRTKENKMASRGPFSPQLFLLCAPAKVISFKPPLARQLGALGFKSSSLLQVSAFDSLGLDLKNQVQYASRVDVGKQEKEGVGVVFY